MISKKPIYAIMLLAGAMLTATSCSDEYAYGEPDNGTGNRVMFGASIVEDRGLAVRGNPGLDSIYVAYDPWDQDFYIQLNTTDDSGSPEVRYGVYGVPSAFEGRLDPVNSVRQLDWLNLNREHTFYSWTIPWMETSPSYLEGTSGAAQEDENEEEQKYYVPSADTIPVYFRNSSEENGFKLNQNNAIYEGFIGAKSGSYAYTEHGKYVDLTFHHLVSKIRVESLILVQTDGSVQKDLQADMTFVGMPVKATFYPHPKEGDNSGAPDGWRPYVGAPYIGSPDTGVTYYIHNRAETEDLFYICPEVDFSNIDYQIKINTQGYETLQTYYGRFDEVEFVREPGWGYDRPNDANGNTVDSKILHAGEMMRLNIVLIPGKGPGLKVIIQDWSTDKPVESEYHSHQGFYSDAELQELMDMMFDITSSTYDDLPEEMQLLFDMYGYTGEDGKKYFPLYENVTPRKGNNVSNIFPIPPGYIIDGMGHTVTLKTNSGNYWDEGTSLYFNIGGQCRDIYFSDENGNNTIYIDKEGYVWITDSVTGLLKQTENKIPDPMPANTKGFDISCKSGKIRNTGYFNDHITG